MSVFSPYVIDVHVVQALRQLPSPVSPLFQITYKRWASLNGSPVTSAHLT